MPGRSLEPSKDAVASNEMRVYAKHDAHVKLAVQDELPSALSTACHDRVWSAIRAAIEVARTHGRDQAGKFHRSRTLVDMSCCSRSQLTCRDGALR